MVDIPMPKLSMNMSHGVVVEWLVDDGADVEEDQDVAEVESEKSTAVVEAPASGTLSIAVQAGENVPVGESIGSVDAGDGVGGEAGEASETGEPAASAEPSESAGPAGPEAGGSAGPTGNGEASTATGDQRAPAAAGGPTDATGRIRASPAARRAARSADLDLGAVQGSGPDGAVVLADIEAAEAEGVEAEGVAAEPAEATGAATAEEEGEAGLPRAAASEPAGAPPVRERRPLRGVRATVAERLSRSWREAPHVTVDREIDMTAALEATDQLEAQLDVDVSLEALLVAVTAEALARHPEFNATLEDGEHVLYDRVDVCVAVDTDRGLLSPVIPGVRSRGFGDLVRERATLVEQTLSGEVDGDRLSGGTFTITNLGPFGVSSFTPIVNPPQVAILGVSATRREAKEAAEVAPAADERVVFRDVLTASLSFDHRAVDGAAAARFLATLDDLLQRPLAVLVG